MLRNALIAGLLVVAPAATADHGSGRETTRFTVRIENVSSTETLKLSNGSTAPAPNSPGLYVVTLGRSPVFRSGRPAGAGLEAQAEDGNPDALAAAVRGAKGVLASGVFNVPAGDAMPGPALPGKSYEFSFMAGRGARLHLTTMFGQSNDLFYAPDANGIALFDRQGRPVSGDVTGQLALWDAGTEVNQEPGLGPDQAPRQPMPNTGAAEARPVGPVKDGFAYPPVNAVLRVTITASSALASH